MPFSSNGGLACGPASFRSSWRIWFARLLVPAPGFLQPSQPRDELAVLRVVQGQRVLRLHDRVRVQHRHDLAGRETSRAAGPFLGRSGSRRCACGRTRCGQRRDGKKRGDEQMSNHGWSLIDVMRFDSAPFHLRIEQAAQLGAFLGGQLEREPARPIPGTG